ncbi:MAG: protein-L-isoaspartate(D-aspartate) O-methyltransferase [Planctomycetota bacterium]
MVEGQIARRGIRDERVLEAFRRVPREEFVPEGYRRSAYEDHPLDIGSGQTISQPYMVALMTEALALTGKEGVLEIGTGSGYQTAILAVLAKRVYTIERIATLSERARETLERLGYANVEYHVGDGTLGWPERRTFERIMVTAAAPSVPEPLGTQLGEGGLLVIPVGGPWEQSLCVVEKRGGGLTQRSVCGCVFVKLIGEHGWKVDDVDWGGA